jgi:hypothetical protein
MAGGPFSIRNTKPREIAALVFGDASADEHLSILNSKFSISRSEEKPRFPAAFRFNGERPSGHLSILNSQF